MYISTYGISMVKYLIYEQLCSLFRIWQTPVD